MGSTCGSLIEEGSVKTNTLNVCLPHSLPQRLLQHWAEQYGKFKVDEPSSFLRYKREKEQLWKGKRERKITDELSSKLIFFRVCMEVKTNGKPIPLKPLLLTYPSLSLQMPPSRIYGYGSICTTERGEETSLRTLWNSSAGLLCNTLTSIGYQPSPFISGMLLYLIIKLLNYEFKN